MVVAPEFAHERTRVLLPLMRYIYEYAARYFDLRFLVIGASPLHIVEYEAVLGFKALPALKRPHVVFDKQPMAMAAALELRKVPEWLREQYGHLSIEQNLYAYFVEARFDNLLFPGVRYDGSSVSGMAPELVDEFFNRRTNIFAELESIRRSKWLTDDEIALIWSMRDAGRTTRDIAAAIGRSKDTVYHVLRQKTYQNDRHRPSRATKPRKAVRKHHSRWLPGEKAQDIYDFLKAGYPNVDVAWAVGCSISTVQRHKTAMREQQKVALI